MKTLTTLSNGIRIATESIKDCHHVSLRCMMCVGGINDPKSLSGLAHVLEHSLFLGTKTRTEDDIISEQRDMGDLINAETSRQTMTFVATVVPEDLSKVMALFADVIRNPIFPADLLEREKKVIITEVRDMFDVNRLGFMMSESAFGDTPMAQPTGGYPDTVSQITPAALNRFHKTYFRPENFIISVAGQVDADTFVEQCKQLYGDFKNTGKQPKLLPSPYRGGGMWTETYEDTDSFVLAFNGIPVMERKERQTAALFASMLETVLEQELRLKNGLLYSIMAEHADLGTGDGLFVITASCEPDKVQPIVKKICDVLNNFEQHVSEKDLNIVKKRKKLLLCDFNPMERADINVTQVRFFNQLFDAADAHQRIDSVTLQDIFTVARRLLDCQPTFGCLGHEENKSFGKHIDKWLHPCRMRVIDKKKLSVSRQKEKRKKELLRE